MKQQLAKQERHKLEEIKTFKQKQGVCMHESPVSSSLNNDAEIADRGCTFLLVIVTIITTTINNNNDK